MNVKQEIKDLQSRVAIEQQIIDEEQYDWDDAPVICQLNGFEYRLGPESPEDLNWHDAIDWCKSVGGELPSREVLLMCYVNEAIRNHRAASYYWSSTENGDSEAWIHSFNNGSQYGTSKNNNINVRAVKRFPISQ